MGNGSAPKRKLAEREQMAFAFFYNSASATSLAYSNGMGLICACDEFVAVDVVDVRMDGVGHTCCGEIFVVCDETFLRSEISSTVQFDIFRR